MNDIHRIIEQFGLESTFTANLVQPPCNEQGHLQLDQVAQNHIQPGLDCLQGWGIHHVSGQPVPVFYHLIVQNFFLAPSLNLPLLV